MKSKVILFTLMFLLFIGFFTGNFIKICNAEDQYSISIIDKSYEFVRTVEVGDQTYVYYNITIIMNNSGNDISDNITLHIEDDQGYSGYYYYTFSPKELKEFIFDDWPLLGLGEHQININFYPTDLDVTISEDNSGSTSLVLSTDGESDDKSTPGFELVSLISAMSAIVLYLFIRKK